MESLIQSGSAEFCGVMNQDFSCMLMLQVEDLVRNTTVNASLPQLSMEEEVSWCGKPFQLLVLVRCFTVKSKWMLWNTGEYCRKSCFPQLKSCFQKRNNQMLFFNKTMLLPTLQRQPKRGLRTSPSDSCFGPARAQILALLRIFGLTLNTNEETVFNYESTVWSHQHWVEQHWLFFL